MHRRRRTDATLGEYRHARRLAAEEATILAAAEAQAAHAAEAQAALAGLASAVQREAHVQIARVVTTCLKSVFAGNAYGFKIRFDRRRGKTEACLLFTRKGRDVDPRDAYGGAVDVAAFALRVAALLLSTPRRRKFLYLDEPFRNVHGTANRRRCVDMVETLAADLGIQFVVNTGLDWLRPGKVVNLGREHINE
jgi:hypothetical protein